MTASPSLMTDAEAQEALRRIVFQMSDAEANRLRSEIVRLGQYLRAVASRATPPLPAGFVAVPRELIQHATSVVEGVLNLCCPKPQTSWDDPTEYHGGQALEELGRVGCALHELAASPPPPAEPAAEALHPECSICRRHHGNEVIHECE